MFGQLCEPPELRLPGAGLPGGFPGARLFGAGVFVVVDGVVVVWVLEVVDVAALAIAAPPPASAPVTATVASRGVSRICFTSF